MTSDQDQLLSAFLYAYITGLSDAIYADSNDCNSIIFHIQVADLTVIFATSHDSPKKHTTRESIHSLSSFRVYVLQSYSKTRSTSVLIIRIFILLPYSRCKRVCNIVT